MNKFSKAKAKQSQDKVNQAASGRQSAAGMSAKDMVDMESSFQLIPGEQIVKIPVDDVYAVEQVRKHFPEDEILALGTSMKAIGQIEPIVVSPQDAKGFRIQKGECRWRGARMVSLKTVDAVVRHPGTQAEVLTGQLVENINRINNDPFEIGDGFLELERMGVTRKKILAVTGKKDAYVSTHMKAAKAPEFVRKAYYAKRIGDVETINQLRQIADLDEAKAKELASVGCRRVEAQDTLRLLKDANRKKQERKQNRSVSEQVSQTPSSSAAQPVVSSSPVTEATVAAAKPVSTAGTLVVRVSLDGDQGYLPLDTPCEPGFVHVRLDHGGDITAPATEVKLLGTAYADI